jgi:hypothetical protein
MEEWFYVKNDLKEREDIKEVIMRPIWSHFGLRRPKVEIDEAAEACQKAFGTVCFFIGTRDLFQEHIAFRVWPLVENWEMPNETVTKSSEGDLVRLKYTFRYGDKFDEPNDDWLKCIEATSDELLGSYSKAEDNALSTAFGGWGKKRLNRVFDAIGFAYPDYRYPLRGQGKKRKAATSTTSDEPVPKGKKLKVLTHQPRYIELVVVPEFGGEASSAAKSRELVPPTLSALQPRGVPGPTSKLSQRVPAQMGRRETEHEGGGGETAKGKPAASVLSCAQVGCACSRGLQASAREREREPYAVARSPARPTFPYESPGPSFYRRKERAQVYNGGCSSVLTCLAERS